MGGPRLLTGSRCYSAACSGASSRKAGSEASAAGIERLRRAQAFGQPAGIGDEPFSLRCHFLLLQIGDQLGGVVTLRLPHVSDDLRPGNAVEIILRACHPAGLRHVERPSAVAS